MDARDPLDRIMQCSHCEWVGRLSQCKLKASPVSCPRCECGEVGYLIPDGDFLRPGKWTVN